MAARAGAPGPWGEVRCHHSLPKKGSAIIQNRPRDAGADLLGVCLADGETFLAVEDAVDFYQLPVVITIFSKEGPKEAAKRAYVKF